MRENVAMKARRLLVEGRVRIIYVTDDEADIAAEVRGDSARIYSSGYSMGEGWFCDCAARGTCAHVRAVMLVTVVRGGPS